ncbi:unnamed protein product [Tilletia caries]|uniref:Uncharacterized protein n=1 Tax=Tilletia caries TaxID=13290 RepID=A0A177V861_9BASI|nr:hypothetical protein CF336_g537 [Tilletia laevis]KAE8264987.1 hypothetical protein A4X03_0g562 [Tilletia caries]CAD6885311.1 unnamed protein product [Tilletia caries]CAD6938916.1 unnamed protein product [Tilletia caries]CAD7066981.1 unnamed protein product [Tilletia caries]
MGSPLNLPAAASGAQHRLIMSESKAQHDQTTSPTRKRKRSPSAASHPSPSASTGSVRKQVVGKEAYAWPAPASALKNAERFILRCARAGEKVLLVPDKDADGLSAGVILYRTLRALGLDESLLDVHLMSKGNHPASTSEREAMQAYGAKWVIVLDQGSREGPALVEGAEHGWEWEAVDDPQSTMSSADKVYTMVLDHHFLPNPTEGGPRGALLVNASHSEPVATTALLTWHLCRPLLTSSKAKSGAGLSDAEAGDLIDWLCLIGTMGDLSVSVKWDPPFPDMAAQIKRWTKKKLGTAIALLNAPRRTPAFDTITAWRVLLKADSPAFIADGLNSPASSTHSAELVKDLARLHAARESVAAETERCTHTPPKFSRDGRIALLRIRSGFQVHPGIATRWSGTLRGAKKLQAVMCANDGYSESGSSAGAAGGIVAQQDADGPRGGLTHFSCRIAQAAKTRGEDPDLIDLLHDYAARDPNFLRDLKQATEDSESGIDEGDDLGPIIASTSPEQPTKGETTASLSSPSSSAEGSSQQQQDRVSVGNFARGHRQASGGIIPHEFFERFVALMEIGVKDPVEPGSSTSPARKKKKDSTGPPQSNTLMNYFKKV